MELETIFLILVGIVSGFTGWWCSNIWKDLKTVSENLNAVRVDLPMNYVRRTDFESQIIRMEKSTSEAINRIEKVHGETSLRMEAKIDKIIDALDKKQDKL